MEKRDTLKERKQKTVEMINKNIIMKNNKPKQFIKLIESSDFQGTLVMVQTRHEFC